jgi:hypothetical protein
LKSSDSGLSTAFSGKNHNLLCHCYPARPAQSTSVPPRSA